MRAPLPGIHLKGEAEVDRALCGRREGSLQNGMGNAHSANKGALAKGQHSYRTAREGGFEGAIFNFYVCGVCDMCESVCV